MKAFQTKGWLLFALLLLSAIALALLFQRFHLPAPWLFGPLVMAAIFAVRSWEAVSVPDPIYIAAQAVIGTALGAGFSPKTFGILSQHFPVFLFAVLFILLTSLLNGWILSRYTRLPPTTAFLGTLPGGAGAMAAMSDSLHANTQLVVAMQYIRLLLILGSMALILPLFDYLHITMTIGATLLLKTAPVATGGKLGILVLLALAGWAAGTFTRIPAGTFLIPAFLYFLLAWSGVLLGAWPWWVQCIAYLIMGLRIGGRFHPSTISTLRDVLFPVVGTTLLLLVGSTILAWGLALSMNLDLVSAYLASTPGGMESVAIISSQLTVDTGIILTVHWVRLLCVLLFGPWLVRGCARWIKKID